MSMVLTKCRGCLHFRLDDLSPSLPCRRGFSSCPAARTGRVRRRHLPVSHRRLAKSPINDRPSSFPLPLTITSTLHHGPFASPTTSAVTATSTVTSVAASSSSRPIDPTLPGSTFLFLTPRPRSPPVDNRSSSNHPKALCDMSLLPALPVIHSLPLARQAMGWAHDGEATDKEGMMRLALVGDGVLYAWGINALSGVDGWGNAEIAVRLRH